DHHLKMDIAGWGTSRGTGPEAAHPPVVRREHRWEQHPRMGETRGGRQRNKRANLRLARDARGRSRRTPVQQEPLRQGQGRLLRRVAPVLAFYGPPWIMWLQKRPSFVDNLESVEGPAANPRAHP